MLDFTIDFESYFDKDVNIKKLSPLQYVRHPAFKVHMAGVKWDDAPADWLNHAHLTQLFNDLDWSDKRVISHNANFDLLVLHEHYRVHPGSRVDTLGLCRALLPRDLAFDLDTIAPMLGGTGKLGGGAALDAVKGVINPTTEQLQALGEYAIGDTENCYHIFKTLWPELPEMERRIMDQVLRFSTQGVFEGGADSLKAFEQARKEITDDREAKLKRVPYTAKQLRSRDQFAQILKNRGVEPPTKKSPANGEQTWAFAKQDPDYVALQADERVADVVQARMAVVSNNAITRIDRLVDIVTKPPYTIPVQLQYNGAHTGRFSGGGKINMQNLNARGVGSSLRKGIRVRNDYVILVRDQKGIELRMNMWFSGQLDVLETIRQGGDVYIDEACAQFNKPPADIDSLERMLGKVIRLGAQYGMGPPKFRLFVASGPLGMPPRYLTEYEAYQTIMTYRANHQHVVNSWHWLTERAIPHMFNKQGRPLEGKGVIYEYEQIRLPNGLALNYTGLEPTEDGWTFGVQRLHRLWGGTVQENLCQSLSGVLIKEQMDAIDTTFNGDLFTRLYQQTRTEQLERDIYEQLANHAAVVHQVHDEILIACRERDVDAITREVDAIMTTPPSWAPDLPLEVEGGFAQEYSK